MIRLVLTRAIAADLGLLVLRVFTGALLIAPWPMLRWRLP